MSRYAECVSALKKSKKLTDADAEMLVNEMHERKTQLGPAAQEDEIIRQMAESFDAQKREALERRRAEALQIAANRRLNTTIDNLLASNPKADTYDALTAITVGLAKRGLGSRMSIDAARTAIYQRYQNEWLAGWGKIAEANGLKKSYIGDMLVRRDAGPERMDFIKEVIEPGSTENQMMRQAAEVFRKVNDDIFKREKASGSRWGEIDNYWPQTHNKLKLQEAKNGGQRGWVDFISDKLDWERTMPDVAPGERRGVLEGMWNAIVSGQDIEFMEASKRRPGVFGRKSRTLHFKDAESFISYHDKYGNGSLINSIDNRLRQGAKRLSMSETLGPRAFDNLANVVENRKIKLEVELRDLDSTSKEWKAKNTELQRLHKGWNTSTGIPDGELANFMKVLNGETSNVVSPSLARVGQALRVWQALSKMGMAAFSAVTDAPFVMMTQRVAGAGMGDRYYNALFDYFKGFKGRRGEILREFGFLNKTQLGYLMDQFDIHNDPVMGTAAKTMNRFYKWNGLEWMSEQKKAAHADFMSRWFGGMKDKTFDKLEKAQQGVLEYNGIDAAKWDMFRQMTEEVEGSHMLSPTRARHLSADKLERMLPQSLRGDIPPQGYSVERFQNAKANALDRVRWDLERDLMAWFADDSKFGVMEPDARATAFMTQGTRPGTWSGEFARMLFQFKSWPVMAIQRQIRGQRWQRFGAEGIDAPGVIEFMTVLLASGLFAQGLKDVAKGRTPKDISKWETWMAAMVQGGAFGLYTDFIFSPANTRGDKISEFLTGPAIGALSPFFNLPSQIMSGKPEQAEKGVVRAVSQNIPFGNLFYLKAATDWAFINRLKNATNPGWQARSDRDMRRTYGQERLFKN